ncbi:ATP-dependent RNA helicase, RhlE1 [Sesbania bispinosa]|nr:ATP-dependent RNA helicase, RhlE1 [Sesbania bispinosa]
MPPGHNELWSTHQLESPPPPLLHHLLTAHIVGIAFRRQLVSSMTSGGLNPH